MVEDMRREQHLLGAAVSQTRINNKPPDVFHSYRGPLFVFGMLMVMWAISIHVI